MTPGGQHRANTWQGNFPHENVATDGYKRTSPVTAYPPNDYGVHDLIGNVWEWTRDTVDADRPYDSLRACCPPQTPFGRHTAGFTGASDAARRARHKVIKGGSFLCAPNFCGCYRPAARHALPVDTTACNIGFRCIVRAPTGGRSG